MPTIQVFCGSRPGITPHYAEAARELGMLMAQRAYPLVFGGGRVGLMGVLADSVLAHGGHVIGVIPDFLVDRELGHPGVQQMIVVDSMHARKVAMASHSQATIALAGSYGTLDELFEMMTLVQLGRYQQPVGLVNTLGYFDALLAQLDRMQLEGFLRPEHRNFLLVADTSAALLNLIEHWQPGPDLPKWEQVKP